MREIIIGIIGIIVGILGLMFGSKKSQQVKELKEENKTFADHIIKKDEQIKATISEVKTTKEEVEKIKEERDEKKPVNDTIGDKLDRLRK